MKNLADHRLRAEAFADAVEADADADAADAADAADNDVRSLYNTLATCPRQPSTYSRRSAR